MKDIIKKALENNNISQKELAEKIYVTPQAVSKRIRGESQPSLDNIQMMSKVFGEEFKKEILKKGVFRKMKMDAKYNKDIKEINTYEKVINEAELILQNNGIERFSGIVYTMLRWHLTELIGYVYAMSYESTSENDPYETTYSSIYSILSQEYFDYFSDEPDNILEATEYEKCGIEGFSKDNPGIELFLECSQVDYLFKDALKIIDEKTKVEFMIALMSLAD